MAEAFSANVVAEVIKIFRSKYPAVKFELFTAMANQVQDRIDRGTLDVGFLLEPVNVVQIEAWAPFGEGRGGMFSNETIAKIADKYNKTVAQVILRWEMQRGIVVIPKSTHVERMQENFDVFDFTLSDEDMQVMATLTRRKVSSSRTTTLISWNGL